MIIKPLYPKNGEGFHLKSNSLKKIKCLARVYRQCLTSSLIMAHEITTTIIFPLFSGAMASLGWVLTTIIFPLFSGAMASLGWVLTTIIFPLFSGAMASLGWVLTTIIFPLFSGAMASLGYVLTIIIFPLFTGAMASLGWVLTEEEDRKIALRRRRLQERALRIGNPWNTTIAVNYIHSMHSRATWHNCIDFIYSTILYNVECFVCKGFIKFIQYKFNKPSLRLKSNSGRYHCQE